MNKFIEKSNYRGTVVAPPSKSYAHRLLICAALADGVSHITNLASSQDILATTECIKALGAKVTLNESKTEMWVTGIGNNSFTSNTEPNVFFCNESGSTIRFMIPIAKTLFDKTAFVGTERLIERGVDVYNPIFEANNISLTKGSVDDFPSENPSIKFNSFNVTGELKAGNYEILGNISSQYVSGLLFALPRLMGNSVLKLIPPVESSNYIDITIDALKRFGIVINQKDELTYEIPGNQCYKPLDFQVEGDWSNAAFLFALNHIGNPDNQVTPTGLNEQSFQGDKVCVEALNSLSLGFSEIDLTNCPDLAPVLFAVAAANYGAHFVGTKRLAIKESNRGLAMQEELRKLNVNVIVNENDITVEAPKNGLSTPKEIISGHNDHRIVMAMTLLLTLTGGEISDSEAVRKSFPDFFTVYGGLKQ